MSAHSDRLLVDMAAAMVAAEQEFIYPVRPLVARGFLTVIGGRHSSLKTWLMLLAGHAVHSGKADIAGLACTQGVTLYVDAENGPRLIGKRFHVAAVPADGLLVADGTLLRLPEHISELGELIEEVGASFVVLDSLRRLAPAVEENNSDKMAPLVADIANLARKLDVAIGLIHHRSSKDGAATLRGSSTIEDQADIVFTLEHVKGDSDPHRRRLSCKKFRLDEEPPDMWLRLAVGVGGSPLVAAEPYIEGERAPSLPETLAGQLRKLASQVRAEGGWAPHRLAAAVSRSQDDGSFKNALKVLVDAGEWVGDGSTRNRRYRPADQSLDSGGGQSRPNSPNTQNGPVNLGDSGVRLRARTARLNREPENDAPDSGGGAQIEPYTVEQTTLDVEPEPPPRDAVSPSPEPECAAEPKHEPDVEPEVEPDADDGRQGAEAACGRHAGRDWRLAAGGAWSCGLCHPPVAGLDIEWREGKP